MADAPREETTTMNASFPRLCRWYVDALVLVGAVPLAMAVSAAIEQPPHPGWLLLAAACLLSGPLAIRIPSISATISVSEGFIIAAGLLFGPGAGVITAVLDGLGVSLWNRHRSVRRTLFNVAEPAISVSMAMWLFYTLSGATPLLDQGAAVLPLFAPLLVMMVTYFGLNTALTAIVVWLEDGTSPLLLVRKHLSHLTWDFCVSLSLAAIIVETSDDVTTAVIVVLVPMLLASYLSSHFVAGRLEESDRHLAELRRLYDSTVATLAMAIDAKDQITHGHIRRVQLLSTRLAQAVGASEDEVKALEAAALLHDLGKLAVPEHILNKPGALTPAEYEQMKAHASIGASILSGIEFPFPVVPLVRHHHENWDGTGYPDGLRGEQIPLGARVLAVADCYDALTSDRPYRRRMSPADAVEIIRRRAGRMYDPAIVDAFATIYDTVPLEDKFADTTLTMRLPLRLSPVVAANASAASRGSSTTRLSERRQSVCDFVGRLCSATEQELGRAVTSFVEDVLPDAAAALYRFDPGSDQLVLEAAAGRLADVVPTTVRLGAGVTGWVGVNRVAMANSDAALDLGDAALDVWPPLHLSVSAPIVQKNVLHGVLTVYSSFAFTAVGAVRATSGFVDCAGGRLRVSRCSGGVDRRDALSCPGSAERRRTLCRGLSSRRDRPHRHGAHAHCRARTRFRERTGEAGAVHRHAATHPDQPRPVHLRRERALPRPGCGDRAGIRNRGILERDRRRRHRQPGELGAERGNQGGAPRRLADLNGMEPAVGLEPTYAASTHVGRTAAPFRRLDTLRVLVLTADTIRC
jgi:putative nucleotidyltransferase with HDIG domain